MNARHLIRLAPVALLGCQLFAGAALAQQVSPGTAATAREVVELKGGGVMFDPIIIGMIEQTKGALLQTNPQLSKDLNEVSQQLRAEFVPRRSEILAEVAKLYAQRFSEQELKEIAAFYKTPTGKKMIVLEPQVLDEAFNFVQQQWTPRVGEEVMNRFRAEMKKKGHNL